jgi:hypothetical protein
MHRPVVAPLAELARAVERIDDPQAARLQARRVVGRFLGEDGVARARLGEPRQDQRVRLAVAARAIRPRGLNGEQQRARLVGDRARQRGIGGELAGPHRAPPIAGCGAAIARRSETSDPVCISARLGEGAG